MQFLAARSRWVFMLARYSIPLATCKHMSVNRFVSAKIYVIMHIIYNFAFTYSSDRTVVTFDFKTTKHTHVSVT